jgi:hypothetical protein
MLICICTHTHTHTNTHKIMGLYLPEYSYLRGHPTALISGDSQRYILFLLFERCWWCAGKINDPSLSLSYHYACEYNLIALIRYRMESLNNPKMDNIKVPFIVFEINSWLFCLSMLQLFHFCQSSKESFDQWSMLVAMNYLVKYWIRWIQFNQTILFL